MSAVDDLRQTVLQGADASGVLVRAVIELADSIEELRAKVFPADPPATDPAVIAQQPITTESPQLSGSPVAVEQGSA